MTRPVLKPGTNVYFDSIGLDTVIVCIASHSGLFSISWCHACERSGASYLRTSGIRKRSKKHGQPCQILFFFRVQRTDLEKLDLNIRLAPACLIHVCARRTVFQKMKTELFESATLPLAELLLEGKHLKTNIDSGQEFRTI